jgi:4-amino-4-deoxy-L-arabinose transferase-like glycosyltransferase
MLSIAYAGVPIFLPVWWPFSFYNSRYGLEMLPAFAAFTAAAAFALIRFAASRRWRLAISLIFILLTAASYAIVWRKGPVSFEEAVVNSRSRIAMESALATNLELLPANSTYLMYLGDHVGAFERAGIPLSHVINEGNHRPWKRPRDPEGLWEKALADPTAYVDFVIAFDSDAVAKTANKDELTSLLILRVTGQPEATIYRTNRSNQGR